ncbi:MAG: RNA 2',3'-cyclic phosphodiesterase [Candidatus Caldarchaeum sp.]
MVRAFIAVDVVDENVVRQVVSVQNELSRFGGNGLKHVEPENLHLTLRFLGEIEDAGVEIASEALRKVQASPFTITFSGLGYFPGGGRVNVIWVGVTEGADKLEDIHSQLEKNLANMRLEKERFSPHLTICRVKFVKDRNGLLSVISKNSKTFFGSQRVERIALKKSVLTSSGPIYSDIMVRKL